MTTLPVFINKQLTLIIIACTFLYSPSVLCEARYYFDFSLVGSEAEGPRPTADWDLGTYRGLSINPAIGMQKRIDNNFLALQFEIFNHSSNPLFSSDADLEVEGHLIKAMAGIEVIPNWSLYFGIGRGNATIAMDNSTCLSYSGCLADQYPAVRSSASLSATVLGVNWEYEEGVQAYLGFQTVRSGSLNFRDASGISYYENRLKLPTSFIGIRYLF